MFDPKLKRQLYLTQDWEAAWCAVVKPWLTASERMETGMVVVPTRGQARAMRSRMAREGVATIGVGFITPGLIMAGLSEGGIAGGESPDRATVEFGLKHALAEMGLQPGISEEETGLTASLLSRPRDPIDDWEDLIRSGLSEESFPHPYLRRVFRRLRNWLGRNGFQVPFEVENDPLGPEKRGAFSWGKVLFYGFSAGMRPAWPYLGACCRAAERVVSVVPYPSFSGKPIEEQWVELWEAMMGCEAVSLPDQQERDNAALARDWAPNLPEPDGCSAHERMRLLVGTDTEAEMALVFGQVVGWLARGAGQIGVVFPGGSFAVADLGRRLTEAGIRFCDEVSTTGAPAMEIGLIRACLEYQRTGGRLDELWILARLLRSGGLIGLTPGESRNWIERVFDTTQSHRVAEALNVPEIIRLRGSDDMIGLIRTLETWPESLSIDSALERINRYIETWGIESPIRQGGAEQLRRCDSRAYPREAVVDLLIASLPERAPRQGLVRDDFAPVVLTTLGRAESLVWSHLVFTGSTAEGRAAPREETYWLSDAARRELNRRLGDPLQLVLTEDSSILERLACLGLCSNVTGEIAFSASLQADDGIETERTPHPWLERILLRRARSLAGDSVESEGVFRREWRALSMGHPPSSARLSDLRDWASVWARRRDPREPFDAHFYCAAPDGLSERRWAARLLERGLSDPVALWYEGVLRLHPVSERPLERSRRKELGLLVHRLLAQALRGDRPSGVIQLAPEATDCRSRLSKLLQSWRRSRPADAYWDSFYLELASTVYGLFDVIACEIEGNYLAIEYALPAEAILTTARGGIRISGRLDLAVLDRPEWSGASVRVIDFKTGGDSALNAEKMGCGGQSLQLGVYLRSVMALGARRASVEMIRIGRDPGPSIGDGELSMIQPAFEVLGEMVHSGRFGQLTPDRTRFKRVFDAPLACVPVLGAVLRQKYRVTFPGVWDEGRTEGPK